MMKPLMGSKIAVLVANGFNEQNFLKTQKMMLEMGATLRVISTNQGLVNGWEGQGWGHNYAVDAQLNTALGVDYDGLVIPGGHRSNDKLKMTAHTRRFIGSFMAAGKPVALMDDAITLAAEAEQLEGQTVAGPVEAREVVTQMGAIWSEQPMVIHNNMMSGLCDESNSANYFAMFRDFFTEMTNQDMDKAA